MFLTVRVAVRVDMGRKPAEKLMKELELAVKLVSYRRHIVEVEPALVFAEDVPVQADRELWIRSTERDRLLGSLRGDHQARARDDASTVALDNPAVDTGRVAEVVGVDDQELRHTYVRPRSRRRRVATARASKCSSATARAARQWRR